MVPRIRWQFVFCAICVLYFIVFYFINYYWAQTVHTSEIQHLMKPFEHFSQNERNARVKNYHNNPFEEPLVTPRRNFDSTSNNDSTWAISTEAVPQPDVQMLELYDKLALKGRAGAVGKQIWNITYDPHRFSENYMLKVFVVPHSHNDPGWVNTLDEYYEHNMKRILSNALQYLRANAKMTFIWTEVIHFSRFYEALEQQDKYDVKSLVQNKQLEFVNGGWVMPDESNSHWLSVLVQLTEGHTWLWQHLNVTLTSSWAIDTFGHSPTMPYILQKSGFENLLIQRAHYSVKKVLAAEKQLEFYWRQLWDNNGNTELFTHMMPFSSYDILHSCGPDPMICCKFDFMRPCSSGVPPLRINKTNVQQSAELLVDQWKKKAELYRTNALLIPLGNDLAYSSTEEWKVRQVNYEALFDHINADPKYHVMAKFGTLQEYFNAVHRDYQHWFPTLSGDFFTYTESGYYMPRPHHKRMDRILLHYLRAAEMLYSWRGWKNSAKFDHMLRDARRQLALFQQQGMAEPHVLADYARRMNDAVKACGFIMQQSVYRLLTKPVDYTPDLTYHYFYIDDSRWPGLNKNRTTIILDPKSPTKQVVLHNLLGYWREEIVDFYVSTPFVSVTDFSGSSVHAQVAPVWIWVKHNHAKRITPHGSSTKYQLFFKARVPPMGLVTYTISRENAKADLSSTSFASNLILTQSPLSIDLGGYPEKVQISPLREFMVRVDEGPAVSFGIDGLMKSIQTGKNSPRLSVRLKFVQYKAYLLMPNGAQQELVSKHSPVVRVSEGPLVSTISVAMSFATHRMVLRSGDPPEIRNIMYIKDKEVAMRFSTLIRNGNTFYTDLNGLQMIKRRCLHKRRHQANFYPVSAAIYIEDVTTRLTVLSAQPLGGSSLLQGDLEILQHCRTKYDDKRGKNPIENIFHVVLEKIDTCHRLPQTHPMGALTLAAHRSLKTLLNPIDKFIYAGNYWFDKLAEFGTTRTSIEDDLEVVVQRNLETTTNLVGYEHPEYHHALRTGIIVHRTRLLQCAGQAAFTGMVDLFAVMDMNITSFFLSNLTLLPSATLVDGHRVQLCEMDTKAFIGTHNSTGEVDLTHVF